MQLVIKVDLIRQIEDKLTERFQRAYCILTGSGTTAIYLTLKALGLKRDDAVLMPGICCFAPAYAVKYAGLNLDFCDISLKDGCLTGESLVLALKKNPNIKVLIGVHLFGNTFELDTIRDVCINNNLVFIEDACQAYSSYYKGSPSGLWGDFSVLSFGHTKILDAGGGGALLTDNRNIADYIRKQAKAIPCYDTSLISSQMKKHSEKYYALQMMCRAQPWERALLGSLWKGYNHVFIHRINLEILPKLRVLLKNEYKIVHHRMKLARLYRMLLKNCQKISFVESDYRVVPWRFSFLFDGGKTTYFCDTLRREGFEVSNWYPNLANMFNQDFRRRLDNANIFEKRVVNLWVDETKDVSYVKKTCNLIKSFF